MVRGRHIFAALILALAGGGVAHAEDLPPLRENRHINGSLLSAAIGDEIRKHCPTISPRLFLAMKKAWELEQYARKLGYSDAQIEAFLESERERDRMRALRDKYLRANGVIKGDAESYCRLGRAEIAKGTLTGILLREN
ncbi:hypothetical protein C8N32_101200 [Rhodovulum imhoffii]|uniref:DUF5333 domain-containing protein n=1 Tax=Rhodovulum imhoffii TaxID=365340 RepID=A0A2T5BWI3_9RHOB|nr:DUF5333 domain-containing protein [Rhodovulum imhoffii]MBK5935033.1 hypothetical protein [Rhodovulum imhoffii]PTN04003.1 hypothetical protein C8N32_101200 [Rhodovulum imhoffii]